MSAQTSGYVRPNSHPVLPELYWPSNELCTNASAGCPEQVHLSLGGPGEMIVVWATTDDTTASEVTYWNASISARATGSVSAYSQLIYLVSELTDPDIGTASASTAELLRMQDTTSWAVDPFMCPSAEPSLLDAGATSVLKPAPSLR